MITKRDTDILIEFGYALCWIAQAVADGPNYAGQAITRAREHLSCMAALAPEDPEDG